MKPRYMTEERMRLGIERLLAAPKDLGASGALVIDTVVPQAKAGDAHQRLYVKYRKELKRALAEAVEWWDGRTEVFMEELGDDKQARMANWREFPAGPASDPYTVATMRKYWLACDELNAKCAPEQRVAPEVFLLGWIVDDGDWATAELVSAMPYWPIGLDAEGAWV